MNGLMDEMGAQLLRNGLVADLCGKRKKEKRLLKSDFPEKVFAIEVENQDDFFGICGDATGKGG